MVLKNKRLSKKLRKTRKLHKGGNQITVYPPASINNYISNVVYVNLDSRIDRKHRLEKELQIFDKSKIHRIPGIVPEIQDNINKNIALARAHLNGIQLAKNNNWENVLMLEDDSYWTNINTAYPVFERLVKQPYDVIMLASQQQKYNKDTLKVTEAPGGSAYLIHKNHYDIFITKLNEMISSYKPGVLIHHENVTLLDRRVFGYLQKHHNWYAVMPPLMKQASGYSDRLSKHIDYSGE